MNKHFFNEIFIHLENLKKMFLTFWNKLNTPFLEHKRLKKAIFISFILAVIPFLCCLIFFESFYNLIGIIFLIPFLLVYFVAKIAVYLYKIPHCKFLSQLLAFCLNAFIIIVCQIIVGLFVFTFAIIFDIEKKSNKIQYYNLALKQFDSNFIQHFPHKIPLNATRKVIKTSTISFYGSENIYLKFNIDKNYIDKELNKYSFIKILSYEEFNKQYRAFPESNNIDSFIFYIINDKEHEMLPKHKFPYYYGIATNPDRTQIVYFYVTPD